MSEQQAEETHDPGEPSGAVGAGATPGEAAAALAMSVLESPAIAPDHEAPPKAEATPDVPNVDVPKVEASGLETPKSESHKNDAPKTELARSGVPRSSGRVLIMSPSDRAWHDHSVELKVEAAEARAGAQAKTDTNAESRMHAEAAPKARRSFPAMAAMLLLATVAGAIGGALATTGLTHVADATATTSVPPAASAKDALEASVARIDADIVALKSGLEHTSKLGVTQFNKTSDRLDKIEKAQAEPNAKLAKLTEAVDKLRSAQPAAPVQAAAAAPAAAAPKQVKEVTGSVTTPAGAAPLPAASAGPAVASAAAAPAKPEVGRLPTVEGWTLSDVGYGGALIQNRRGTYEVYAGDYIPGIGRIDAIRKQDGRWVVVTSKGLIVAR